MRRFTALIFSILLLSPGLAMAQISADGVREAGEVGGMVALYVVFGLVGFLIWCLVIYFIIKLGVRDGMIEADAKLGGPRARAQATLRQPSSSAAHAPLERIENLDALVEAAAGPADAGPFFDIDYVGVDDRNYSRKIQAVNIAAAKAEANRRGVRVISVRPCKEAS